MFIYFSRNFTDSTVRVAECIHSICSTQELNELQVQALLLPLFVYLGSSACPRQEKLHTYVKFTHQISIPLLSNGASRLFLDKLVSPPGRN